MDIDIRISLVTLLLSQQQNRNGKRRIVLSDLSDFVQLRELLLSGKSKSTKRSVRSDDNEMIKVKIGFVLILATRSSLTHALAFPFPFPILAIPPPLPLPLPPTSSKVVEGGSTAFPFPFPLLTLELDPPTSPDSTTAFAFPFPFPFPSPVAVPFETIPFDEEEVGTRVFELDFPLPFDDFLAVAAAAALSTVCSTCEAVVSEPIGEGGTSGSPSSVAAPSPPFATRLPLRFSTAKECAQARGQTRYKDSKEKKMKVYLLQLH